MRLHSLDLIPDEAGQIRVRDDWQRLQDAGLPSQANHQAASNAPHITAVAAPAISPDDAARAAELFAPKLPIEVDVSGLMVLGGRRKVLARVIVVPDRLTAVILELRRALPGVQHGGWLPHVTLARGLRPDQIEQAFEALDLDHEPLRLSELRKWDPDARTVTTLVPDGP